MKSKSICSFLIILFISFFSINPISSQEKWQVIFGSEEFTGLVKKNLPEDLPEKVLVNKDGDIYITSTNSLNNGDPKPNTLGTWIAKFNKTGKFLWWRSPHENFQVFSPSVVALTSDASIVSAGKSAYGSLGLDTDGIELFKYDKNGNKIFQISSASKGKFCDRGLCARYNDIPLFMFEGENKHIQVVTLLSVEVKEQKGDTTYFNLVRKPALISFDRNGKYVSTKFLDLPENPGVNQFATSANGGFYFFQHQKE